MTPPMPMPVHERLGTAATWQFQISGYPCLSLFILVIASIHYATLLADVAHSDIPQNSR
jgi:hypothetical protein